MKTTKSLHSPAGNKCGRNAYAIVQRISLCMMVWAKFWFNVALRQRFLPGMLDATAGGVVQADEQMLESARREAEEELGIAGVPFAEHGQFYFEDQNCRVWGGLFSCVSHGPFALQEEEISEVCWLTPEEITARCDEFTPDSLKALSLWMTRNAKNESLKEEETE